MEKAWCETGFVMKLEIKLPNPVERREEETQRGGTDTIGVCAALVASMACSSREVSPTLCRETLHKGSSLWLGHRTKARHGGKKTATLGKTFHLDKEGGGRIQLSACRKHYEREGRGKQEKCTLLLCKESPPLPKVEMGNKNGGSSAR